MIYFSKASLSTLVFLRNKPIRGRITMNSSLASPKIFISHSYKDRLLVDALVDLLTKAGIKSEQIVSSSTPGSQLHTGKPLYEILRNELSNEKVFVIFMLSDNFYSSKVCLNEMGAVWIQQAKSEMIILPGFSFSKVEGVICEKNPVGIALDHYDKATAERFDHLRSDLSKHFGHKLSTAKWNLAILDFFKAVDAYKKTLMPKNPISMKDCENVCINDLKHDGCFFLGAESSENKTTAVIDFSLTTSSLCSIVFHTTVYDWSAYIAEKKQLCFDIYADAQNVQAEVELHLAKGRNIRTPIIVTGNILSYRIPLTQFTVLESAWQDVTQICFLFSNETIKNKTKIIIDNLRLE